MNEWLRYHQPPRKCWYRASYDRPMTPKKKYLYDRSRERYLKTPDGIALTAMGKSTMLIGEIGSYSGVTLHYE